MAVFEEEKSSGSDGGDSEDDDTSVSSGKSQKTEHDSTKKDDEVINIDARKGRVGVSRGIITGVTNGSAGDGYSHWKLDETGWWLQYADGSYATGYTVSDVEGNVREIWAWEYINGAWWAFGADGYAHIGWLYDTILNGWFYIDADTGMKIGWHLMDGKWYYFNVVSDGTLGKLYIDMITPDGYYVDENGVWIE